jgi:hypothetical protein
MFTRKTALLLGEGGEFSEARRLFDLVGPGWAAETDARFSGFDRALLTRNADNYGLYFVMRNVRTPFLWFGLAWSASDPPGTLPSWGASLEVDGTAIDRYERNDGGLRDAFEAVDREAGRIRRHRFARHVELAEWRSFEWLLEQADQAAALERFWLEYLDGLARGGVPACVDAFIREGAVLAG